MAEGRVEKDQLGLFNGTSAVYVAGRADYDGDAESCVAGEADAIARADGIEDVEILTGDDGEPIASAGDGFAFGMYSLVSNDGGDATVQIAYIECRTVIEGEAVVSLVGAMPLDAFETEFDAVLALSGALTVGVN